MSNTKPLVTVITVSYNSQKYITDAMQSVLQQTYPNIRYIVIDGDSKDSTVSIISQYEDKFNGRMKWISEKDNGIYDAMNKGINMVSDPASYIIFLNSDDYFASEHSIDNIMNEINDEDFIYGKLKLIDNEYIQEVGNEIDLNILAYKSICFHPTVFTKKSVFEKLGIFCNEYKVAADYEFFVRVFKDSAISKRFVPQLVTTMRIGGVSTTNVKLSMREKLRIINKYYSFGTCIRAWMFINLYELPRNNLRIILSKVGLLEKWRRLKQYGR